MYVADDGDNEVRKISTAGTISRVAGTGAACASPPACGDGGAALNATLGAPDGVAVDQRGNLYIADDLDDEVRVLTAAGTISRVAGTGTACASPSACGNGTSALTAQLNYPDAVAVDPLGDVFVADTYDQQLRLLSPARGSSIPGSVSVLALAAAVARGAVTVRYLLSGPAALVLSVHATRGPPRSCRARRGPRRVGYAQVQPAGEARELPAEPVTATVGGRSATSSVSVRL